MTNPITYHAVLYRGTDGVQFEGPKCSTRECALQTINPLDGTTVLGLIELDREPGTALAFWKRHQVATTMREDKAVTDLLETRTTHG